MAERAAVERAATAQGSVARAAAVRGGVARAAAERGGVARAEACEVLATSDSRIQFLQLYMVRVSYWSPPCIITRSIYSLKTLLRRH